MTIYSEGHKLHIDNRCGQNAEFLILKQVVLIVTKIDRHIC